MYIVSHEFNLHFDEVYWNSQLEGEVHFRMYT